MVQLSSFAVYANTQAATPLPDLTVTFRQKAAVSCAGEVPGEPEYGVQFNFLSFGGAGPWAQPGFMLLGPRDVPANALAYGVDVMPTAIYPIGNLYVVKPTANYGNVFPDTGVDFKRFNSGEIYVLMTLTASTGKLHVELRDSATGAVAWSTGTAEFPDFTYTRAQLPYVLSVEAVGKYSGELATFTAFDAEVEIQAAGEIRAQVAASPNVVFGTYDDGTGDGVMPLFWQDETGERSNLWTNVNSQTPTSASFELALAEGNQQTDNPPLPSALQDAVLTLKAT